MRAGDLARWGVNGGNGGFTRAEYPDVPLWVKVKDVAGEGELSNTVVSIQAFNTLERSLWDIDASVEVDQCEHFGFVGVKADGSPIFLSA